MNRDPSTPFIVVGLGVLLAACQPAVSSSPGPANANAVEPQQPALLVDDFEDGDGQSVLGGYWYTYDDHGEGGASRTEVPQTGGALRMEGEGFESARSLRVGYTLDQGTLSYPPFIGIGVGLQGAHRDLREYGALEYSYRGGGHEVRIETANVEAYDFHAVKLPASDTWRTVTLDFAMFRQGGWGPKVAFEIANTDAIGWQVRGKTGDAGDFELDGVRLVSRAAAQATRTPTLRVLDPAPPEPTPLESMTITHPLHARALESLDRGYNITNWLEQDAFDGEYRYDEAFVERLAKAGFRSLRLPIDLDRYIRARTKDAALIEVDPVLFEILDNFERWTAAHGLSLTIDYHQYDHSYEVESAQVQAEMAALWGKVAEHFADNPREDLFYELLNEPELAAGSRGPTAAEWTALASSMIAAIRKHDAARPILFGDVKWYGIDELSAREPFADPNIIYVFHFYDPFIFTHQGASWAGMGSTGDLPYPYSRERWSEYQEDFGFGELNEPWQLDQLRNYYRDGSREAMRNRLVKAKAWAVRHDVPLICNEFGAHEASSREEDVVRYYADVIGLFEELEIPWQLWFMLMDAESGALDEDYARALGL